MSNKNVATVKENMGYLRNRMAMLEARRNQLQAEFDQSGNADTYRQLNVVEYSITCTNNRINGSFRLNRIDFGISISGPVPAKFK